MGNPSEPLVVMCGFLWLPPGCPGAGQQTSRVAPKGRQGSPKETKQGSKRALRRANRSPKDAQLAALGTPGDALGSRLRFSGYLAGVLSGFWSRLRFSSYLAGVLSGFQSRLRFSSYLAGVLSGFWSRLWFSGRPASDMFFLTFPTLRFFNLPQPLL